MICNVLQILPTVAYAPQMTSSQQAEIGIVCIDRTHVGEIAAPRPPQGDPPPPSNPPPAALSGAAGPHRLYQLC